MCHSDILIKHSGRYDIETPISLAKHQENVRNSGSSHMLQSFLQQRSNVRDNSVIRAECMMASFIVQNNLPIAVTDKLSPLISSVMTLCKDNILLLCRSHADVRISSKRWQRTAICAQRIFLLGAFPF